MFRTAITTLVVALALIVSGVAAATTSLSVTQVKYANGDLTVYVQVAVPKAVDDAARGGGAAYSLHITLFYGSNMGTFEEFEATVPLSETTLVGPIDQNTVEVSVAVAIQNPVPSPNNPNFQPTAELLAPEVTPLGLCLLTKQFVQSSAKYQALSPAQQTKVDAAGNALCQKLAAVVPTLTPVQKAKLVSGYKLGVDVLAAFEWLSASQASTLKGLADSL